MPFPEKAHDNINNYVVYSTVGCRRPGGVQPSSLDRSYFSQIKPISFLFQARTSFLFQARTRARACTIMYLYMYNHVPVHVHMANGQQKWTFREIFSKMSFFHFSVHRYVVNQHTEFRAKISMYVGSTAS